LSVLSAFHPLLFRCQKQTRLQTPFGHHLPKSRRDLKVSKN